MSIAITIIISTLITIALALLFSSMGEQENENNEENISFECGFINISASNIIFSTNFIMVIIIFLIFDIEISILITITMSSKLIVTEIVISTSFIIIVTILLLNEWWQGAIEWMS